MAWAVLTCCVMLRHHDIPNRGLAVEALLAVDFLGRSTHPKQGLTMDSETTFLKPSFRLVLQPVKGQLEVKVQVVAAPAPEAPAGGDGRH